MPDVENSIGSMGQDYGDPFLWEGAIPANSTNKYIGTIEVDEAYNGVFIVNVANSNAQQHTLDVALGIRHDFQAGNGARIYTTINTATLYYATRNFKFSNLSIEQTGNSVYGIYMAYAATGDVLFDNCFIGKPQTGSGTAIYIYTTGSGAKIEFNKCSITSAMGSVVQLVESNSGKSISFQNCSLLGTGGYIFNNSCGTGTDAAVEVDSCKVLGTPSTAWVTGGGSYTGANNVIGASSAWTGITAIATSQSASDHYANATVATADLSIKIGLDRSLYIGGDALAGEQDVQGDTFTTGYCDTGCDSESVAPSGGDAQKGKLWIGVGIRV